LLFFVGAATLPYALSQSSVRETLKTPLEAVGLQSQPADPVAATSQGALSHGSAQVPGVPGVAPAQPRTASDVKLVPFEQALSWNVKPAWVLSTWPRVTTALPELDLNGYRVTFISGTSPSDLAGSLSYYFDTKLQLQRIVFQGSTGDARRLVQFLMSQHHFERRMDADTSVYLYQVPQDGRALSALRIKTAPVVRSAEALARFDVTLEMRRPD
jgi:hypothetical protein